MLSQDVEQLLNAHGISSLGAGAVLQNLHALVSAAESGLPRLQPATYRSRVQ